MRIVRSALYPFELPLARPLATAHETIETRPGYLVELVDREGRRGFGEATPLPEFGSESLDACRVALEAMLRAWVEIEDDAARDEGAAARVVAAAQRTPCARAALEAAQLDLAARRMGLTLAAALCDRAGGAAAPLSRVRVQALVSGETPERVAANAGAALASGHRAFKLKLGVTPAAPSLDRDLDRVAALREVVGPAACLRVDANEAWSRTDAFAALEALAAFGIDFVEQPVARREIAVLRELAKAAPTAIAADESLIDGEMHEQCLKSRAAQVFVLKPALLGGFGAGIASARRAAEAGIRVVWSNLIDGAVGRAMPLALAAACSDENEVHGVGTAGHLAADLDGGRAPDRVVVDGSIRLASAPGLGFEPDLGRRDGGSPFGAPIAFERSA